MPSKEVISAATGIKSPLLSQGIKYGDTIYVSGNVGMDFVKNKMAQGSVADRTVWFQCLAENISNVDDSDKLFSTWKQS